MNNDEQLNSKADEIKLESDYRRIRQSYKSVANKVSNLIKDILHNNKIDYHAVTYRVKKVDSYVKKAQSPKYTDPLNQILDLAGIRIIAYVERDLERICKIIEENFLVDTLNSPNKNKELGEDRVGYRSVHYVCSLDESRTSLPEYGVHKGLKFEIQIRTILQHSWAEIEHDRNYKFSSVLPIDIKRRLKLIAGTLEILDREFDQISEEIDRHNIEVKEKTDKGDYDLEIDSSSLNSFLKKKFEKAIDAGVLFPYFHSHMDETDGIVELKKYGITSLHELDHIIPINLEKFLIENNIGVSNFIGLVRYIMLLHDYNRYFDQSYDKDWSGLSDIDKFLLNGFKVDVNDIERRLFNALNSN